MRDRADVLVLDAAALLDLVCRAGESDWIADRLRGMEVVVPGHVLGEVLSAVGRRCRSGDLSEGDALTALQRAARMPMTGVPVADLLTGAWARHGHISLRDALYVELADRLGTHVVTTDRRLARATPLAVAPPG